MSSMQSAQETITAAVDELRRARHERQEDLAPVLGLSQPAVSRRLAGKTRWTADDIDRLARHFAVPLPRLLSATHPYRAAAGQAHADAGGEATLPQRPSMIDTVTRLGAAWVLAA